MKYDDVRIEVYYTTRIVPIRYNWTNISDYVNDDSPITFSRGIMGNGLQDRTARPGALTFTMKADAAVPERFEPMGYSASYLYPGLFIRVVFELDGIDYVKWFGVIDKIFPPINYLYGNTVQVQCKDFLYYISQELATPGITTDYTAAQVVDEIIEKLGITLGSDQYVYNACETTFPTVFDTVTSKQNALSEISKAIISELGYFYLNGNRNVYTPTNSSDRIPDEGNFTIIVDGRNTREARSYRTIPIGVDVAGFLLQENADYLLQETGDKIILDQVETPEKFDNGRIGGYDPSMHIVTKCTVQVYPRVLGTPGEVIFTLQSTPKIDAGETLTMTVKYNDPSDEYRSITARSAINPIATTDYTANAASDGTGTDLTSSLTVTAVYNAADIQYTLENTGVTDLYVTKLQARGTGVYFYNPLQAVDESSLVSSFFGQRDQTINMKYRSDINEGNAIAQAVINALEEPTRQVQTFTVNANESSRHLFLCMFLEIGDPIKLTLLDEVTFTPTDYKFYINGMTWTGRRGNWDVTYVPCSTEISEI